MLKDDKSYPFIKVTNERYPKLIITRKVLKDGALYFGPYPDARQRMKQNGSWTACFHYANVVHRKNALVSTIILGQCVCPYVHHMDPKEYRKIVDQVKHFSTVAMLRSKKN